MKKTILEPTTLVALQVGEVEVLPDGVLVGGTNFYPVPPFIVHDGVPPDSRPGFWRLVGAEWVPPPESAAAVAASKAAALKYWDGVVQARLDLAAREFGYGDPNRPEVSPILHAISYADEPVVPKFQAEGRLLRAWRSIYWASAGAMSNAVEAGTIPVPSEDELITELDRTAPPPTAADVIAEMVRLTGDGPPATVN